MFHFMPLTTRQACALLPRPYLKTGSTLPVAKMTGKRKAAKPAKTEATGSVAIDHTRYEKTAFTDPKTGKSRSSVSNGDAIAIAMMHLNGEEAVKTCARKNGLKDEVADRDFANPGMRRMALGNRLRAAVRKGEPVTIGDHEVKKLDQRVPLPAGEARAAKTVSRKAKPAAKAKRTKKDDAPVAEAAE